MNIRKLPSCVLYKGRVSHTVIPCADAGVTPHCDAGQNTQLLAGFRVGAECPPPHRSVG